MPFTAPRIALAFCLSIAGLTITPARAGDLDFLWPANRADLGKIDWTGIVLKPDPGLNTFKFTGAGSDKLKTAKGVSIGGEVGYNYQVAGIVVGGSLSLSWSGVKGNQADGVANDIQTRLDYFGNLKGRVGYVFDRFMVYGTGGYAFTRLTVEDRTLRLTEKHNLSGWVAGGGVEWVYNKSNNLRFEVTRTQYAERAFSDLPVASNKIGGTMDQFKVDFVHRF